MERSTSSSVVLSPPEKRAARYRSPARRHTIPLPPCSASSSSPEWIAGRRKKGETVIVEGTGGAAFFIIDSGSATVSNKGIEIATLGPGDYFGEVALIDGGTRYWEVDAGEGANERTKESFLANAIALLFPIDWPEPFGLVIIEAIACGTPVIAFRRGSVPEIIEDGVTGFIVDNEAQALQAIERTGELDRKRVRAAFERRFTARRMAEDYLRHYEMLVRSLPIAV